MHRRARLYFILVLMSGLILESSRMADAQGLRKAIREGADSFRFCAAPGFNISLLLSTGLNTGSTPSPISAPWRIQRGSELESPASAATQDAGFRELVSFVKQDLLEVQGSIFMRQELINPIQS